MDYSYIAGAGGLGQGILFRFPEDRTLGRNESRLAELTNARDYCKGHIILHYAALFGRRRVPVYAIGRVGNDTPGAETLQLMEAAGIDCRYVHKDASHPTLYSVCFLYPNGDGGNITTAESASSHVSPGDIAAFFPESGAAGKGIVIAAPEIPPESRVRLLQLGRARGCLNIACINSAEMEFFCKDGILSLIDILSLNKDEASAAAGLAGSAEEDYAGMCAHFLQSANPALRLIVTKGTEGAELFEGGRRQLYPAVAAEFMSSAGAGDCFIGTMAAALLHGLPLEAEPGCDAMRLALAAAALKVTSCDTIFFGMTPEKLERFIDEREICISEEARRVFFR